MLKGAISECPEALWTGGTPPRSFWRLAYHTLYFAHLHLQVRFEDFVPWELHRDEVESDAEHETFDPVPYTKAELLAYWELADPEPHHGEVCGRLRVCTPKLSQTVMETIHTPMTIASRMEGGNPSRRFLALGTSWFFCSTSSFFCDTSLFLAA